MAKDEKKSILDVIYNVAINNAKYYTDKSDTTYAKTNDDNHLMSIESTSFQNWLLNVCRIKENKIVAIDSVKHVLPHLGQEAVRLDYYVKKRCCFLDGVIYIDMVNEKHEIICIDEEGVEVVNDTGLPVLRTINTMLELPYPDFRVNPHELPKLLKKHFLLTKQQSILLTVFIVACFIDIQTPILNLVGEKGASKSTFAKQVKRLIDPTIDEIVMLPASERDTAILCDSSYVLAIDNISDGDISSRISDVLSIAVTLGVYSVRKLYTNDEVTHVNLSCRLIINGISNSLLKKSDSLDRSIIFKLQRIPVEKMKSMKELTKSFDQDRCKILGSICNTLTKVLDMIDGVQITSFSRMNDFARYGYAIAEVTGIGGETFVQAYKDNIQDVNELLLREDPISYCILEIMETRDTLTESVSELFQRVQEVASFNTISLKLLPASPNHFSTRLLELKSNLEQAGIILTKRNTGKHKEITLEKTH